MTNHTPRFLLNMLAMSLLGAGALLTTVIEPGSTLNGVLWGALVTWFAAARVNGRKQAGSVQDAKA